MASRLTEIPDTTPTTLLEEAVHKLGIQARRRLVRRRLVPVDDAMPPTVSTSTVSAASLTKFLGMPNGECQVRRTVKNKDVAGLNRVVKWVSNVLLRVVNLIDITPPSNNESPPPCGVPTASTILSWVAARLDIKPLQKRLVNETAQHTVDMTGTVHTRYWRYWLTAVHTITYCPPRCRRKYSRQGDSLQVDSRGPRWHATRGHANTGDVGSRNKKSASDVAKAHEHPGQEEGGTW